MTRVAAALALSIGASACAVPHDAGFGDVRRQVGERSGYGVVWSRGTAADRLVAEALRGMLARPLTLDACVKIALLQNPRLLARYEDLGVAQAELVQAGMIANPQLGLALRFPHAAGVTTLDGDFGLGFTSLLTLLARKRVAAERFEAVKLETSHAVLSHIAEVKKAFYRVQAAQQRLAVDHVIAQAAQASFDSAKALSEAGNLSDLKLAREQALYERVRLSLVDSQEEVLTARAELDRLLGLWGSTVQWQIHDVLQGIPADEVALEDLERIAIRGRLDLAASKRRTMAWVQAVKLAGDWGWLGSFDAGASLEHAGGATAIGPAVSVELPVFDQGQARRAMLRAELQRSWHETSALAVDIRAEVRTLRRRLLAHRNKAIHYRDVVIPLRERILALALRHYNFMLLGVFELLEEKRQEQEAYHAYIAEVRSYWVARADLELAVGGRLPPPFRPTAIKPAPAPPPPAPQPHPHHH